MRANMQELKNSNREMNMVVWNLVAIKTRYGAKCTRILGRVRARGYLW